MSEMLANHYFMIRNFNTAIELYERVVEIIGRTKSVQKKMIICYIKTNQIQKAKQEFCDLVEKDVAFITQTNFKNNDCPCSDIIKEIEAGFINLSLKERDLALGMIWLYCDKNNSIEFLEKHLLQNPNDFPIAKALHIIKEYSQYDLSN